MTDQPPTFPPMHPVTRLGRVIQQLTSFGSLHANELEGMAQELDVAGARQIALRLRAYRDVQRDEAQMVVDELVDIQTDLVNSAGAVEPQISPAVDPHDPAANSPRRAKWLAEQAAEAERPRQPLSRRDLLSHGPAKDDA